MKKFAISLIACLAFLQSSYAATSPLASSLLEYQAITNAIGTNPDFEHVIGSNEFIVDIKRKTKEINILGEVKYKIVTSRVTGDDKKEKHTQIYIATLQVSPNPGVGPRIVTVLSIEKKHKSQQ